MMMMVHVTVRAAPEGVARQIEEAIPGRRRMLGDALRGGVRAAGARPAPSLSK